MNQKSKEIFSEMEYLIFALMGISDCPDSKEEFMYKISNKEFSFEQNDYMFALLTKYIENWKEIDRMKVSKNFMCVKKYIKISNK